MVRKAEVFEEFSTYIRRQVKKNPKSQYYSSLDIFNETLSFSKHLIYHKILSTRTDEELSMLKPLRVQSQSQLNNKNFPHNVVQLNLMVDSKEIRHVEEEFGNFDIVKKA
jgi:hypothetical protein